MPHQAPDDWKVRLLRCFDEARGHEGHLGITTRRLQGDLLVFCRDYITERSTCLAHVKPPAITFFITALLAEMRNLRRRAQSKPAGMCQPEFAPRTKGAAR